MYLENTEVKKPNLKLGQIVIFDTFRNKNPVYDHNEAIKLRPYNNTTFDVED